MYIEGINHLDIACLTFWEQTKQLKQFSHGSLTVLSWFSHSSLTVLSGFSDSYLEQSQET